MYKLCYASKLYMWKNREHSCDNKQGSKQLILEQKHWLRRQEVALLLFKRYKSGFMFVRMMFSKYLQYFKS